MRFYGKPFHLRDKGKAYKTMRTENPPLPKGNLKINLKMLKKLMADQEMSWTTLLHRILRVPRSRHWRWTAVYEGRMQASHQMVKRIASALGVTFEELWNFAPGAVSRSPDAD